MGRDNGQEEVNYMFEKLRGHVGHDVVVVMYGGQNISIECEDCCEVLYSVDKYDI